MPTPDDLITVRTAAVLAGKCQRTIRRWMDRGWIKTYKTATGKRMVSRGEVLTRRGEKAA